MKKFTRIDIGSTVKNLTDGEIGVVVEIIGEKNKPFGYLVQTRRGIRRWIIRRKQ